MPWTVPDDIATRYLRRRRWKQRAGWTVLALVAVTAILAHLGAAHGQTDWSRYQHRTVRLTAVTDGQTLICTNPDGSSDTLRLLGVAAPLGKEFGSAAAVRYLQERAQGRDATLLLQWPQTRDDHGRLLAFVFLGTELLNAAEVRDGAAYAERRTTCLLQEPIDTAERVARKSKRGMWRTLTWERTPLWRRQWFATRP